MAIILDDKVATASHLPRWEATFDQRTSRTSDWRYTPFRHNIISLKYRPDEIKLIDYKIHDNKQFIIQSQRFEISTLHFILKNDGYVYIYSVEIIGSIDFDATFIFKC